MIFIHPQPTAHELKELYTSEYFEGGDFRCGHEERYSSPSSLARVADLGLLHEIKSMTRGRRLLEIGCAGGAFLDAARKQGFQVQGVEVSADACRFARDTFGLEVFQGELRDARFSDGSFDVVFMGDVIEHLPDPVAALREVNRVLATDGLLVLALPAQTNSLFSRIGFLVYGLLGRSATVMMPPYHLFEYRPRSIRFVLKLCGFEVVRIEQGIIPPGQINLRGSRILRIAKKVLQYPNYALTRTFGCCGDRMLVAATKR